MVDHRRALIDQPFADAVQRLQIELIVGLNRHEAHVLAIYRFGDRFAIEEVILVRLQERFDELRWNQPRVVPLLAECSR